MLENTSAFDCVGTGAPEDARMCLVWGLCDLGYWGLWGRES